MRFSHPSLLLSALHVLATALAVGLLCRLLMNDTASGLAAALAHALGNTLLLALTAALIGTAGGTLLGVQPALQRSRWPDRLDSAFAMIGVSLPHCWVTLALVAAFSASMGWLPAVDGALLLPAIALGVIPAGSAMRAVRGAAMGIVHHGLGVSQRFAWQVLKNAGPSLLVALALQLPHLVGGAILMETVFGWPGAGHLLHAAIFQRDIPVLQGMVLVLAVIFALFRLFTTHLRRSGGVAAKGI
ncbi:ABC transporter permease [Comamonas endophytica]|uniref:ABC transporter permease n=1 Tax=Comamonas endophytica TaxID=2949090 RepID=A0ABY6G854_9BURK|nr:MULTISPECIES: ABC transporter permease [unclassified Acidovorax]MCD2511248.1 ABC transporter permease [Acidovorax sp. D4N7]UYG50644.1 ABC transporter permease [Acidovorax sp. 5MLIR]